MALPYDIHSNPTFIATQQAKDMVRDVAIGRRTMVLISSDTGFRKSYETKHCLRQCGVPFHECATSTESALVRVLWGIESGLILHKGRKPAVMVADDQDAMFQRPTIANQMKSVFGSDRRCVITQTPEALKNEDRRNSDSDRERAKYKATIAPPTFGVLVRLICHANLNYTDPSVVAGLSEHFRALVSKGLDPHWIPNDAEHDGRDVFLHTHWLASEGNSLRSEGFPYEVARRAVEFYVKKVHLLIDICPRRLSQIAYTILNNPDPSECEKRLSHMLRDTDQRPKLILPESWVPVLLWPDHPPRRPDPQPDLDPPPAARQPDPVDPALGGPAESAPQRDTDPPPVEPVPETATSQQDDPAPETPPSEDHGRDMGATLDRELPVLLDERQAAFFRAVAQIEAIDGHEGMSDQPPLRSDPQPDPEPPSAVSQPDPVGLDLALDPSGTDPQRDPDVPSVEPVPETPELQQDDPVRETATSEDDGRDALGDEQQPQRDPRHTPIGSVNLNDGLDETEEKWDLRPIRAGRAPSEDRAAARRNRAAAFQLLGQIVDDDVFVDQAAKKLRVLGHKFWRSVSNMTLSEVSVADTPNDPPSDFKANSDDPPAGEPP